MAIQIPPRQVKQQGFDYTQRLRADTSGADRLAQGVQQIGQGVAHVMEVERQKADEAQMLDAYGRMQASVTTRTEELRQRRGREAGEFGARAQELLEKDAQAIEKTLGSDAQRQAFAKMRQDATLGFQRAVDGHVAHEADAFAAGAAKGAQEGAIQKAARAVLDNRPAEFQAAIKEGRAAVRALARRHGQDDALTEAQELQFTTSAHETVLDALARADLYKEADQYLRLNKSEIEAGIFSKLEERVRTAGIRGRARDLADEIGAAATTDRGFRFDLGEAMRALDEDEDARANTDLYDAARVRLLQRHQQVESARKAHDDPLVEALSLGLHAAGRIDRGSDSWARLTEEGKHIMLDHERAFRNEGKAAQNDYDQYAELMFMTMPDSEQLSVDIESHPVLRKSSRNTRQKLRLYRRRLEDLGVSAPEFRAQARAKAMELYPKKQAKRQQFEARLMQKYVESREGENKKAKPDQAETDAWVQSAVEDVEVPGRLFGTNTMKRWEAEAAGKEIVGEVVSDDGAASLITIVGPDGRRGQAKVGPELDAWLESHPDWRRE